MLKKIDEYYVISISWMIEILNILFKRSKKCNLNFQLGSLKNCKEPKLLFVCFFLSLFDDMSKYWNFVLTQITLIVPFNNNFNSLKVSLIWGWFFFRIQNYSDAISLILKIIFWHVDFSILNQKYKKDVSEIFKVALRIIVWLKFCIVFKNVYQLILS